MNPDFFFADSCINNHSDYHYGYIHMFWNYDNNSAYLGSTNTYFYQPNYITAHEIEDIQKPVTVIKKDEEGFYVRNWDSSEFKAITSEPIKDLLINTTDQQTLKDVSNQLSDKANLEDVYKYLDVSGIIVTEQVYKNLEYDILRSLDGTKIYKNYEDETYSDEIRYNDQISHNINDVKLILDTSFNSSVIYKTDPDDLKINLNIKDKFATPYRNHYILQWISTPNGLKYYSKPTKAVYNQQYNSYNIISSWNPVIYQKPGYIDTSTLGNEKLFDIIVQGNNVIIDASTQGEQEKVTKIELYQNSELKGQKTVGSDGLCRYNGIFSTITDSTSSAINNAEILNDLYNLSFSSEGEQYILYTIKYSIGEETELTHISTFKYMLQKYDEVRTLPKISLKCYNDMESLEQLNKAENGILCNQFQFFVDLKIDDFNENNWGKITHLLNNPTLKLTLNIDASTCKLNNNTTNTNYTFNDKLLNNNKVRTSVSLLKPNVDIFNITARDLENTNNLYGDIITTDSYNCEFNLDDANKGIYKLRVLIETTNPEPILMKYHVYVSSLSIKAGNNTYKLNDNYLINTNNKEKPYLYDSETLKMVIAPISMIMSYKQNLDDISDIGKYKWFGSEEEINISLKPYKYEWVTDISFDRTKDLRWNSYKIKRRYFQDNIRYIEVDPININYIKDLLPNRLYHNSYLAKDKDDIFDTYLEIIYNGNLFNPFLETDQEIILYNNIGYLLSKYDQYRNNTAVFIKQDFKYEVRTENLLNSMLKWNEEYVKHKYKSDNPYQGHLSTYGNGYQYLDKTIDTGQFIINNYMLLEDVKNINSQYIFEKNTYLTNNINKPDKSDQYTPDKFFRTLLYQAKWCYPYYTTNNGLNLIKQIPLADNVITNNIKPTEMPYNLTYKIYPRVLFNDEEQVNIILMLRRPSIITDGEPSGNTYTDPQYELTKEDLKYKETNIIQELTDPINVMN